MNITIPDITALIFQLARIAVGGVGIYLMIKGQAPLGMTLFGASGLSAGADVLKVKNDKATAVNAAVAGAQSTATVVIKTPAPPAP